MVALRVDFDDFVSRSQICPSLWIQVKREEVIATAIAELISRKLVSSDFLKVRRCLELGISVFLWAWSAHISSKSSSNFRKNTSTPFIRSVYENQVSMCINVHYCHLLPVQLVLPMYHVQSCFG